MYYSQQSPGIAHKLADPSPWSRTHHTVLGPPGPNANIGMPPQSPGYPLFTNGNVNHLHSLPTPHPHMPIQAHHHQNSLTHIPSPPHQQNQHPMAPQNDSPGSITGAQPIMTQHWQNQLLKCEMIRQSRSPHHRARASAMASRTVAKSAIPITNPNLPKPDPNGVPKDTETSTPGTNGAAGSSETTPAVVANHPSAVAGPSEAPRLTAPRPPESNWTSLDMGGVNIKTLPPTSGLFSFTFLATLYLNHNQLTSIPPQISKLRHLELLDLSGNQLRTIPPELGMLTMLKELYLFDNHLTVIPHDLGTLHQLLTLGIEGNPIEPSIKALVQKDGTPALIAYLRDTCPIPPLPPARVWENAVSQQERDASKADPNTEIVTLLCYNVLCERAATAKLYGYTPSWALTWDYRKDLVLAEIIASETDFLCLQEVDVAQYEEFFLENLSQHGYDGAYWPKSRAKHMNEADKRLVDGCAIFFKEEKYTLVEKHLVEFGQIAMQRQDFKKTEDMFNRVLGKGDIAVVCMFETKETGTRFVIANVHIHWDPQFRDVKLVQTALMVDEIDKIVGRFAKYPPRPPAAGEKPVPVYSDGYKIPLIIGGDFNSTPDSGVYEYLSTGSVPPNHPDFMSHTYGRYTSEGMKHRLGLKSAYSFLPTPPTTNHTPGFQGVIDYIWFSTQNLAVNAVLGEVDKKYLEKVIGFPNPHFPSDHLCIIGEFRIKPPRDGNNATSRTQGSTVNPDSNRAR